MVYNFRTKYIVYDYIIRINHIVQTPPPFVTSREIMEEMEDYIFTHGKYQGTKASVMYNNSSYTEWAMRKRGATGPLLRYQVYVAARCKSEAPTTSTNPRAADHNMERHENKIDRLNQLIEALILGEAAPTATNVAPGEAALATLN